MAKFYSEKTKTEVAMEYLKGNVTLRELAPRYNISSETVRRWVMEFEKKANAPVNIAPKPMSQRKLIKLPIEKRFNLSKSWDSKEDDMLKDALRNGFTVKELSDLLGRSIASIYSRKCILISQGQIQKGARFITPSGLLRKAQVRKPVDVEKEESERVCGKYAKLVGITEKEVKPEVSQETKKETDVILNGQTKEVKEVKEVKNVRVVKLDNNTELHVIKLEDLARIVKDLGVNVSISIRNTGTEISIRS